MIKRKEFVLKMFKLYIFLNGCFEKYIYPLKIFETPDLVLPAYPYLLFQDSPGTKPLFYPPPAVQFYISIPQVVSPPLLLGSRGNSHL